MSTIKTEEAAFNATYCVKDGKFIIEKGNREFPFSQSTGDKLRYAFSGDEDDVKMADVILFLAFGFAFLGKVNDGRIQKEIVYINFKPWNLDEGFYLLKEIRQKEPD